MDPILIAIIGVAVTLLAGIPAWYTLVSKSRIFNKKRKSVAAFKTPEDQLAFNKAFGEKLNHFLGNESLSVKDLADLLDEEVTVETVSEWIQGSTFPIRYLPQLLDIIGMIDSDFDMFALKYISSKELSLIKKDTNEKKSLHTNIALLRRTLLLGAEDRKEPIYVIAPYSSLTSQFRDRSSPNYIFVDNLGDRDSLLELTITAARLYPLSPINFFHSKDFSTQLLENDMILLGGTGYAGKPNNHVALSLIQERGIALRYDGDTMIYGRKRWRSKFVDGALAFDVGFFANLKNPWNKKRRIISFQGIHTSGVFGSVRAFSLNAAAVENHKLAQRLFGNGDYCAIFEIRLFDGRPVIPVLKESDFIAL